MRIYVLVLLSVLSVSTSARDPISVCEILQSPERYDGQEVTVKGRYFANRHGSSFAADHCFSEKTGERFAIADWTEYSGEPPKLDEIVKYRDRSGRPSLMDGAVIALVRIRAVQGFRARRDPLSGEEFGNGEGHNGLGAARFYIRGIQVGDKPLLK